MNHDTEMNVGSIAKADLNEALPNHKLLATILPGSALEE